MLPQRHFIFCLFLLAILLPSTCQAWQGQVVAVYDGDTVSVMHEGKAEKIRLYGIRLPRKAPRLRPEGKAVCFGCCFRQAG